jgi:hypothetical protein
MRVAEGAGASLGIGRARYFKSRFAPFLTAILIETFYSTGAGEATAVRQKSGQYQRRVLLMGVVGVFFFGALFAER